MEHSDIADLARVRLHDGSVDMKQRVLAGDTLRYMLLSDGDGSGAEEAARHVLELGVPLLAKDFDKEIYDALERAHITLAENSLHHYLIALEWNRPAKERFYQPRMRIMRPVVEAITDMMVHDRYDVVQVSMPPRVGKTTLGIFTLSWLIGRAPDSPILATGHSEKITKMFYSALLELYQDPAYSYSMIFPYLKLIDTSAKDLTLDFRDDGKEIARKYKSITCRPIDGALTGATEARQLLYVDDLVHDIEEALSVTRLDSLYEKLISNAQSRKKEGCKELHIGTLWSIHDPMARMARQHEGDPRFLSIRIQALDPDTDESNFDYPYGVGFSTEYYRQLRAVYEANGDKVTWECLYQQNPIEREGIVFPAEDLTYFYSLPDIEHNPPDDIFAFCDVAFGGDDFLSMPIAYQWGEDPPVIADVVYMRGDYRATEPVVAGALMAHKVKRAVFEANNGGDFYSRDIADLLKERGYKMSILAKPAPSNKSKETRIIQHAPDIRSFSFHHPSAASPMYKQFLTALTTYTALGKNRNDDAPDSLAGLASMTRSNTAAKIKMYDRAYI